MSKYEYWFELCTKQRSIRILGAQSCGLILCGVPFASLMAAYAFTMEPTPLSMNCRNVVIDTVLDGRVTDPSIKQTQCAHPFLLPGLGSCLCLKKKSVSLLLDNSLYVN